MTGGHQRLVKFQIRIMKTKSTPRNKPGMKKKVSKKKKSQLKPIVIKESSDTDVDNYVREEGGDIIISQECAQILEETFADYKKISKNDDFKIEPTTPTLEDMMSETKTITLTNDDFEMEVGEIYTGDPDFKITGTTAKFLMSHSVSSPSDYIKYLKEHEYLDKK